MPPRKKTKIHPDWSWVELEVESAEEITPLHRRRAAGLVGLQPCKFDYGSTTNGDDAPESSAAGAAKAKAKKVDIGCTERSCKGNPRCYNHLGAEQTVGEKAKEEFIERKMGDEPAQRDLKDPAGLRNMGATCYANSFIQLWFFNLPFRTGLYRAATKSGSPIDHLVRVFAAMQYSNRKVVDPSGLIEALQLKTDDQQDAGEFQKLFMHLIETALKVQNDPSLRNLMERLFQGKLEYLTQCHGCGFTSSREEKFLELELSLKNNETLNQRILALSTEEKLDGDNKYHCGRCNKLCAATRKLRLKELPQYLHFSLMRFTFDFQAQERRKSKVAIRYPKVAEIGGEKYDLSAVVIHLGSSPYHGHFVTEVMDEQTKEWHVCNDEEVTPRQPTSALKKLGQPNDGHESSKDAYMLVFKRRARAGEKEEGAVEPPEEAMREVREMNGRLEGDMRDWVEKCELAAVEFETLNGFKEPVIAALSGEDKIMPRAELERWLKADMANIETPISYTSLACSHSTDDLVRLDPTKMSDSRLISQTAFDQLLSVTPGADAEICAECIEAGFNTRLSLSDREDQVTAFDNLNLPRDGEELYLISKSFLEGWRKHTLPPETLPSDPGYSLYCGHDNPWPLGRLHTLITPSALSLLQSALGDNFPLFTQTAPHCPSCSLDSQADDAIRAEWLVQQKRERPFKREINATKEMLNVDYYILPGPWLAEVRKFHITPGPRPEFRHDLCEHGKLKWDPADDEGVDYTTQKGWEILQQLYGPQEGITLQYVDRTPPGKRFRVDRLSKAVCQPCRRLRRLDWEETKIEVRVVDVKEVKGSEEGSRASSAGPSDTSKVNGKSSTQLPTKRGRPSRTCTGSGPKPITITITPSTTLLEVKGEIYDAFHISHISQSIWYDGVELTDGAKSLKELGMVSCGLLKVVELKEDESLLEGGGKRRKKSGSAGSEDGGFGGTALAGVSVDRPGRPCPDCTFLNELGGQACMVCERPLIWEGEEV